MERIQISEDIKVYYVQADIFNQQGIKEAFEKLSLRVPKGGEWRFYGLSRPNEKGVIEYKAAVEDNSMGELGDLGLPSFIIPKGTYAYIDVANFRENIPAVDNAFYQLTSLRDVDPNGICVESYPNATDLRCLVRVL